VRGEKGKGGVEEEMGGGKMRAVWAKRTKKRGFNFGKI